MKPIIDGKFNPKCVQVEQWNGLTKVAILLPDETRRCFFVHEETGGQLAAKNIREALKACLEEALGHTLKDYAEPEPKPEPNRYFKSSIGNTWKVNADRVLYWGHCGWGGASGNLESMRKLYDEISADEAATRIGRAALGLLPEAESDEAVTDMGWDDNSESGLLYRKHGEGTQYWSAGSGEWRNSVCGHSVLRIPATRQSITEKLGEAPLR